MNKEKKENGVLSSQEIFSLINNNTIYSEQEIDKEIIQPASIDLRLGVKAWRVPASFLPGKGNKVSNRLKTLAMHEFSLMDGAVLECGCVYIVKLLEELSLPNDLSGIANPKSSTGRLDVFTRLIVDGAQEFEDVPSGYQGPLYAEISPRTFSVLVRTGSRLNQLRLRRGVSITSDKEMEILQEHVGLVRSQDDENLPDKIKNGVPLSVDLIGKNGLIGYKARKHSMLIDIDRPNFYKKERTLHHFAKLAYRCRLLNHPDEKTLCRSEKNRSVFHFFSGLPRGQGVASIVLFPFAKFGELRGCYPDQTIFSGKAPNLGGGFGKSVCGFANSACC